MKNKESTKILENQKAVNRVAELKGIGMGYKDIAQAISDEFNIDAPTPSVLKGIIQTFSVKGTEFMEKDKEIALMYKKLLYDLIEEGRDNLKMMQETKKILFTKMKIYEENSVLASDAAEGRAATREMGMYIEKIQNTIRTQNDNIRTLKQMLEVLQSHKKEVTSSIQGFKSINEHLTELEKEGYITIQPEFKENILYLDETQNETDERGYS